MLSSIAAIKVRTSVRTYDPRPPDPASLLSLQQFLEGEQQGPFGTQVRFTLINLNELERDELRGLATYGVISGAAVFLAATVPDGPHAMEDYGWCLERAILHATAQGLGTCWLGGTFNRGGFARSVGLRPGEILPCVTPVGHAAARCSLRDSFFRALAGSRNRKPWHELFFDGDAAYPLDEQAAGKFREPLHCVRIGPSASNKQPWRVVRKNENTFFFFMARTKGYAGKLLPYDIQRLDVGIAMCHFQLACEELDIRGTWNDCRAVAPIGEWEYIATWQTLA